MLGMFEALNPELVDVERQERDAQIRRGQIRREQLALIGYVAPAQRARSLAALWLLHLAMRLDTRIAEAAAEPASLRPA